MYNRILKRPMFRRGGPSYQSQGTGITSPYDIPRGGYYGGGTIGGGMIHGNPMGNRTGFEAPDFQELPKDYQRPEKEVLAEMETIYETPKGQWLDDVIGSFGAYSTPYKESGEAKTIGEMGSEQASSITAIRKERKDKQDLAKLTGLERELLNIDKAAEQSFELKKLSASFGYDKQLTQLAARLDKSTQLAVIEAQGEQLEFKQELKELKKDYEQKAASVTGMHPAEKAEYLAQLKNRYEADRNRVITNNPSLQIRAEEIAKEIIGNQSLMITDMKEATKMAISLIMGIEAGLAELNAKGGRVGYQMGTPNTGAMPNQGSPNIMAQATTDTEVEDAYGVSVDQATEGQQASVQMPYQEFRTSIPAEVSDEIVQLIYYNQDAFADFAQITTQADVYAFNNKYGVSLVLPMDTETT